MDAQPLIDHVADAFGMRAIAMRGESIGLEVAGAAPAGVAYPSTGFVGLGRSLGHTIGIGLRTVEVEGDRDADARLGHVVGLVRDLDLQADISHGTLL